MTELSPAAQQVFWAFNRAASGKPDDWHYLPAIAAALQAVADQPYEVPAWYRGDDCRTYRDGVDAERNRLLAIAAELKAS